MPFLMSRFDAGVHKRDQRALEIRIEEYKAVTKRELQKSAIYSPSSNSVRVDKGV